METRQTKAGKNTGQCLTHINKLSSEIWSCFDNVQFSQKLNVRVLPSRLQTFSRVWKPDETLALVFEIVLQMMIVSLIAISRQKDYDITRFRSFPSIQGCGHFGNIFVRPLEIFIVFAVVCDLRLRKQNFFLSLLNIGFF